MAVIPLRAGVLVSPAIMPAMTEPPRRRAWFQLHLSTCVVLMFVASGLLWTNVRENKSLEVYDNVEIHRSDRGFPLFYFTHGKVVGHYKYKDDEVKEVSHFDSSRMAANISIALGAIMLIAFACEFLRRRRERKRAA